MQLACLDLSAEGPSNNNVDVLVITDHYTKLAQTIPCPCQTSRQVAKKLWDYFFSVYGFPHRYHSDRGACFQPRLIKYILEIAGIEKSQTTPYWNTTSTEELSTYQSDELVCSEEPHTEKEDTSYTEELPTYQSEVLASSEEPDREGMYS